MNAEALRQRRLLDALWSDADGGFDPAGLAAYRGNASATAARALAAAFPTVAALVGDESFALVARRLWRQAPPQRGDLAQWGEALPAFLAADAQLADTPYLADVARVDWAAHVAESAPDAALDPADIARLAEHDAGALRLRLAPGAALVAAMHPVATLWRAHHRPADAGDPFAEARAALAAGRGEIAFVCRPRWRAEVTAVDAATSAFLRAVIGGATLGDALDAAPDLDFEAWLTDALARGGLAGVEIA